MPIGMDKTIRIPEVGSDNDPGQEASIYIAHLTGHEISGLRTTVFLDNRKIASMNLTT